MARFNREAFRLKNILLAISAIFAGFLILWLWRAVFIAIGCLIGWIFSKDLWFIGGVIGFIFSLILESIFDFKKKR